MRPWNRTRTALPAALISSLALALALGACATESQPEPKPQPEKPDPGPRPESPQLGAQTGAQRLTVAQYKNAIKDLFGDDVVVPPSLEPDQTVAGFVAIGASVSTISPIGVERYETAAYKIAEQAMASKEHRAAIVPCAPSGTADAACAAKFAETFGRKVWRRPLAKDEVTAVSGVVTKAATTLEDFYKGVEFGIAALLQSPNFLYRAAVGEADPVNAGKKRYTGYEMASRLSFFFWNTTPDEELLDAAEAGLLTGDKGLAEQAQRLLDSPRAREGFRNFITEWLGLGALDALQKDAKIFTYFSPELGPAAREETLRGFEYIAFEEDGDVRSIFTTRRTFVNPKLASMYMVPAPTDEGFGEVLLPADFPRRGLLGQAAVLALYAHPTSSSATLRGKFVRTQLLCGIIPPPPANVNTGLPEPGGDAVTLRDRVKQHLTDPVCAGCHIQMDPIGLGLENFDGIGRYRTKELDTVIDPSGDLDGEPFKDAADLGRILAEHPAFPACFTKKMYEYATSFEERPAEADTLKALRWDFEVSGYKARNLMLAIAMSPGFRLASDPQ